jgi:hypothetical protein
VEFSTHGIDKSIRSDQEDGQALTPAKRREARRTGLGRQGEAPKDGAFGGGAAGPQADELLADDEDGFVWSPQSYKWTYVQLWQEEADYWLGFTNLFASHVVLCHINSMATATVTERQDSRPLSAEDLFEFWSRRCDEFMDWQRKNFIARQASQEELQEHGKRLDLILGLTLHVYSVASRAMPGAMRAISGRLRQLQDSRTLVDNPTTDQEADAILRQVFPDEPGTGRSA